MYITRFSMRDGSPPTDYKYDKFEDAYKHMVAFKRDTSGLYRNVALINEELGTIIIVLPFDGRKAIGLVWVG